MHACMFVCIYVGMYQHMYVYTYTPAADEDDDDDDDDDLRYIFMPFEVPSANPSPFNAHKHQP